MPFAFKRLSIPEVVLIEPQVFSDSRGVFFETYKESDFLKFGINACFRQDNQSKSVSKGILRGLHFQKNPMAQAKLVRVVSGSIFDVAVDIRKGSATCKKWVSAVISAENKLLLFIPEGFAHGFCTLEDNTEVFYKCSNVYSGEFDCGIRWDDPEINIDWPVKNPVLSLKDSGLPLLKDLDTSF